jgi:Ribonuclease G/E
MPRETNLTIQQLDDHNDITQNSKQIDSPIYKKKIKNISNNLNSNKVDKNWEVNAKRGRWCR